MTASRTIATAPATIGGPDTVLSDGELAAFVAARLAEADLDGARVCVIVPDGTRSCPLPLLIDTVHRALHGRVAQLTVLIALGTHAAMTPDQLAHHLGYQDSGLDRHLSRTCRSAITNGGSPRRSPRSAPSMPIWSASCRVAGWHCPSMWSSTGQSSTMTWSWSSGPSSRTR